jgi:hypothetical protein
MRPSARHSPEIAPESKARPRVSSIQLPSGHSEAYSWGPSIEPVRAQPRSSGLFDAELQKPLRFREAMSALHDVVVGDLRFEKKDKTAYEAWKKRQDEQAQLRVTPTDQAKIDGRSPGNSLPRAIRVSIFAAHRQYWAPASGWANGSRATILVLSPPRPLRSGGQQRAPTWSFECPEGRVGLGGCLGGRS